MKKLLALIMFVSMGASASDLTGTFRAPDGALFNGRIEFQLSHPAVDAAAPSSFVPTVVRFRLRNGTFPSNASVVGNDLLTPANTWYQVTRFDSFGRLVARSNYFVSGTTYNMATAVPTTITQANIAFGEVVLKNPVPSSQTIDKDLLFKGPRPWVDVRAYGAVGDGVADDTAAIQAAIDAADAFRLAAGTEPNIEGGADAVGATVYFPTGIYRVITTLICKAFIIYKGENHRGTVIRLDSATTNTPVFKGTDCRWIHVQDLAFETTAVGLSGQNCLEFARTGPFGIKFTIERAAFFQCWNALEITGDATNTTIRDVYIRKPANYGIHTTSAATLSTPHWSSIYISSPASHAFFLEGGAGSGEISSIITETVVNGDGFHCVGCDRMDFSGIYIGDLVGGNGIKLVNSQNNVFNGLFFNGDSVAPTGQSAIVLDGSRGNQFNGITLAGNWDRYTVEWLNSGGVPADRLFPNVISGMTSTFGGALGFTNDSTYIVTSDVREVPEDETGTSFQAPFRHSEILNDKFSIRTPTSPGTTSNVGYGPPNVNERWSVFRDFPGIDDYSFLSRGQHTIGVLPSTESLGSALITGDSSDFSGGVGSWTLVSGASFSSVAGGFAGNKGLLTADGSGVGKARLSVTTVADKLYKLTFRISNSTPIPTKTFLQVTNSGGGTTLADSRNLHQYTAGDPEEWRVHTLYLVATDAAVLLDLQFVATQAASVVIGIDNVEMKEVLSDKSLRFSGGRRFSTGEGGGAILELFGEDHPTQSNRAVLSGTLLQIPAGTAANPGLLFTGSTDGFYRNGTGVLRMILNGNERVGWFMNASKSQMVVDQLAFEFGAADVLLDRAGANALRLGTGDSFQWGTGTPITGHVSDTASLDFDLSGAGITCQSLPIPVTSAAVGDVVEIGLPVILQLAGVVWDQWVSATGTVTVQACDVDSSGPNPAAATVRADVWQH